MTSEARARRSGWGVGAVRPWGRWGLRSLGRRGSCPPAAPGAGIAAGIRRGGGPSCGSFLPRRPAPRRPPPGRPGRSLYGPGPLGRAPPRAPPRPAPAAPPRAPLRPAPPPAAPRGHSTRDALGAARRPRPADAAHARPAPGPAMAAPRPPPAISVSVSAPAFYAPQKKFAPVVAPKPKVNPFRAGDGEPAPPAPPAGAQRAQMGRVGEIPPPPPEDFPLPPPPVLGLGDSDDAEGALGGAFPPPPPPMIDEPFPPAPLEEEIFPSPPPPLEEGGPEAPLPPPPQPTREKVSSIDLEIDSLSALLDDMTKNDPFKTQVSTTLAPPATISPSLSKLSLGSSTGVAAPLPPWKTPSNSQNLTPAQPQTGQSSSYSQPQSSTPSPAKPQVQPTAQPTYTQPPGPPAPSPAPKFAPVTPKFSPVTSKFNAGPGGPGRPGSPKPGTQPQQKPGAQPQQKSGAQLQPKPKSLEPSANKGGRPPSPQLKEKPQVQEKQQRGRSPIASSENQAQAPGAPGAPGPLTLKEVEELEKLTQQLMHDMDNPPISSGGGAEFCGRCQQPLPRTQPAVRALGQLFHVSCFTCHQCGQQLQGQQFYSLDGAPYCEDCYTDTLEKCSTCGQPITERMLRATGKAYHPQCFTCVVCACPLEGTSFIMDQDNQPHCVADYHKNYAPKCSVCLEPIMPEPGKEETVRVVALDKNFHMKCYKCEDCGKPLSVEADNNGCFPLDGHVLCRKCFGLRTHS